MEIQTLKEDKKENVPIVSVYDIKLKVGDGVRFGFGFGLGVFIWGAVFAVAAFLAAGTLITALASSIKIF